MSWLKSILRPRQTVPTDSSEGPPLFSRDHPAAREIGEAERMAEETIELTVVGSGTMTSFNSADYLRIKEVLDSAIAKSPNDPDLFYARASLHYLALQGEDGMKDRDYCLSLAPAHLDARMKKDHFKSWNHLFQLAGWDEDRSVLPDLMLKHVAVDHVAQVVRDHLRGAIAVVVPAAKISLAGGSKMRWELRWETTPQGKVAAHYLFLNNGKFQEFFIPHVADSEPDLDSNYWLLRRLARERHCFIVVNDGRTVVRNQRYMFPPKLVATLKTMEADLVKSGPAPSSTVCEKAAQWYMQNSDESTLKY